MKRFVEVPYWLWNVYFGLELLGSDNGWQALSAIIFLYLGATLGRAKEGNVSG